MCYFCKKFKLLTMKRIIIAFTTLIAFVANGFTFRESAIDGDCEVYDASPKVAADTVAADTIAARQLGEVVVEADRMYQSLNKMSYLPTKQQRNAAANGVMLLQNLAIPQLQVDVLNGSVTTNTGEPVTFFIDGVPATAADIDGLNTRDVRKVEVLQNPTDPRFRNSRNVVNYVMQKYEYGGYTKLSTTEMLLAGFSTYNTLNSKMVYKKMTFDARAYWQYTNNSHRGSEGEQLFRLPGYEAVAPEGIARISTLDGSKSVGNYPSASLRALYQSNKTQFSSTVNYSHTGVRRYMSAGTLSYSPQIIDAESWENDYPYRTNIVQWNNDLFQILPRNWSVSATFNLGYNHNNQTQVRTEGNNTFRSLRAKENIWTTSGVLNASKQFGNAHTLALGTTAYSYRSNIYYSGSSDATNRTSQLIVAPSASYSFTNSKSLFAKLELYATFYHAENTGVTESEVYPTVQAALSWMPHSNQQLNFNFSYNIDTPAGAQTNDVLMQNNPFMWTKGNPHLKAYHTYIAQLSYTWNPSQIINVTPSATWVGKPGYFADTYRLTDDGRGILTTPENCGDYHNVWGQVNISAFLLKRKLVLSLNPSVSYHKFDGIYRLNCTSALVTASAAYYFGQFYTMLSYTSPRRYYNQADPLRIKKRSEYWLMAGWGNAAWTVQMLVINPFRSHWKVLETTIDTPFYSNSTTSIGVNEHRRINLTVAYTFGYGKKVQRGNDLNGVKSAESSIR